MKLSWCTRINLTVLAIAPILLFVLYLDLTLSDSSENDFASKKGTADFPSYNGTGNVNVEILYQEGHDPFYSELCPDLGINIKLIIAVTSAPDNIDARLAVRRTWGYHATLKGASVAFVLGVTPNRTLTDRINDEQKMYGDILRGKFLDTYENLTLKTISTLEWVDNYCPKAKFMLKTDDDTFINVSHLLAWISKSDTHQRAIYGRVAKHWKPVRDKNSKYYISKEQYQYKIFPFFTTGPAYLVPMKLSRELYAAALEHFYFKLEDVFLTGIVANDLRIRRIHVPAFFNNRVSFTPCNLHNIISMHKIKSEEQYILWSILRKTNGVNCNKRRK